MNNIKDDDETIQQKIATEERTPWLMRRNRTIVKC